MSFGIFCANEGFDKYMTYHREKKRREFHEQLSKELSEKGYNVQKFEQQPLFEPVSERKRMLIQGLFSLMSFGGGVFFLKIFHVTGKSYLRYIKQTTECCYIVRISMFETIIVGLCVFGGSVCFKGSFDVGQQAKYTYDRIKLDMH